MLDWGMAFDGNNQQLNSSNLLWLAGLVTHGFTKSSSEYLEV